MKFEKALDLTSRLSLAAAACAACVGLFNEAQHAAYDNAAQIISGAQAYTEASLAPDVDAAALRSREIADTSLQITLASALFSLGAVTMRQGRRRERTN